ncbi:MAG: LysR family transcriptional regulator [Sutterellaceae bacterium]|nr:LysR family transcriptional regulator [Sutterellaceae bacterium]
MQEIKLSHLQLLLKVLSSGSLSEAAVELGLSASAASRMLKKLQQQLDDPLFVRTWRGMVPTQAAVDMMPVLQDLLAQFDRLEQRKVFRPESLDLTLTIAAADNAIVALVRPVLQKIATVAPEVSVRFVPLDGQWLKRLAEGEVDFALYPTEKMPELPTHYFGVNLNPVGYAILVDENHPLAQKHEQGKKVTIADIVQYPKVLVKLKDSSRETLYELDFPELKKQKVAVEVPYFLGAPYFVEGTQNTLMVPLQTAEFFTQRMPHLRLIPYPLPKTMPEVWTRLLWHERNNNSPAMQWIRSVFVAYAGPLGQHTTTVVPDAENAKTDTPKKRTGSKKSAKTKKAD